MMALTACAQPDEADYPRLLPLSELNQPPAIPAHAADAAADPEAVGAALDARRAAAEARAQAARRPVSDAAALGDRATDLQRRADALARTELPAAQPPRTDTGTAAPTAGPTAAPADTTDPATAARIRALRDRARALSDQPVGAVTPLPDCPPGTADPAAVPCKPQP